MLRRILLLAAAVSAAVSASALEWAPVAKLDLLGGQYFFAEQSTSFGGNANWLLSPGVKLGERDMLVPTLIGQYRRTREVRELVGGGFLTQQTLDNTVALKWVHVLNEKWAVKPSVSYMRQYVTEAEDERLGAGLFDFWKVGAGVEFERRGELFRSIRQGLSTFMVRYPHYHALGSSELGAEVNSGDRVLDFSALDYTAAADVTLGETAVLTGSLLTSYRPYRDQKIVTIEGTYIERNRHDFYVLGALSARKQLPTWTWARLESVAGFNASYARLASNQNNYDAEETRFNPDFYDYNEFSVGPTFAARWNKTLMATFGYDYTRRDFYERPVQDVLGAYVADVVRMHNHALSLTLTYALWRGLSLKSVGYYSIATSNMRFESTYRYNYRAANYFVGLSWSL